MKTALTRFLPAFLLLLTGSSSAPDDQVWQADIQIRTLEVTKSRTAMNVRVVVYTERDDEARDAKLIVLLPPGVGIDKISQGCTASAGPSGVPSLRATVTCDLGSIADRGLGEVLLSTTLPPDALPRKLGVFTYSATPDPAPANNYAERTIQ
jgi:hypothetical protein